MDVGAISESASRDELLCLKVRRSSFVTSPRQSAGMLRTRLIAMKSRDEAGSDNDQFAIDTRARPLLLRVNPRV